MSDQFNVTAAFDKTAYTTGDAMKITITGNDVVTTTETNTATISLVGADGATGSVTVSVPMTKVSNQSVKISGVTDSDGRSWLVASNGLTASATA